MTSRVRVPLAAILAGAFAIRLAFGVLYWVGKPLMLDEQEYLLLATSVARGEGVTYPPPAPGTSPRHFERPPAFAFFLAAVLIIARDPLVTADHPQVLQSSSDVPLSIKLAQSLLGTAAVLLIAAIGGIAGGRRGTLWAGTIAALYPPLAWTCGYVLAEPLYSSLALTAVWLLARPPGVMQLPPRTAFGAGLVCGAALLTKEAMLFFVLLAAAWLLVRRRALTAAALVVGTIVVVGPWVARNHAKYGRFVLTASHGGVTLWTGNNPLARGEGDLAANPDMGRARVAFENAHPGLTNQQLDDLYYRDVIDFVRARPVSWLGLEGKKLFFSFVPIGPSYRLHSARYYLASLVSYALLMPFAIAGLWRLARTGAGGRFWAVWAIGASVIVTSLVFFPQERFRIPVLDPVAIVAAAGLTRRTAVA